MFKFEASFVVHNVASDGLISVHGLEIKPHTKPSNGSHMVSVTYRFATQTPPPDFFQHAKNIIERFLDVSSSNSALFGFDVREIPEEFDVDIENWKELLQAGVQPPTKFSFTFRNWLNWNKDAVQFCWDWAKKLETHKDAEILFRILRLLRQSILEDDEFDRLSKVWRGFNAFYNHLARNPRLSEIDKIVNFAKSLYSRNSDWLKKAIEEYWTPLPKPTPLTSLLTHVVVEGNYVSLMDCLVKQDFKGKKGKNHSKSLASAISAKDIEAALESALLCVYVERNRVMHGETISEEERPLLYICAAFLQRIVAIGLNEFYFIPMQASQPSP